jgi:predicted small metal-binding protein
MVEVQCPVCQNMITGLSSRDLSDNLSRHMYSVHNLSGPGMVRGMPPAGMERTSVERPSSPPMREGMERRPSAELERAHGYSRGGYSREGYYRGSSMGREGPGVAGGIKTESAEVKRGAMGSREAMGYQERGQGVSRARERSPVMVNCPMCGEMLQGYDEDDLSDKLEVHIRTLHGMKPTIGSRVSRV